MLKLHKDYLTNEYRQPIAVQILIDEFEKIEEILENFGLVRLMEEADNDELFLSAIADFLRANSTDVHFFVRNCGLFGDE